MKLPLRYFRLLLLGILLGILSSYIAPVFGQVSFTAGNLVYTQNYNALPSTGTPVFTQNSTIVGIYGERSGTGNTVIAGTGSGNAGGLYSYGATNASDRALGSVGSGAAGNFAYGVRFVNNTGAAITSLRVQYTGEQWRLGVVASQTVDFSYLISATPITTASPSATLPAGYVAVGSLNFVSPVSTGTVGALDGNAAANRTTYDVTIPLTIPAGSEIMLRWGDPDHSGADHGLSIDDVTVTATATPVVGPSLSAAPTTLPAMTTTQGAASSSQSYVLTAQQLTAGITVTAPTNFEVSSDNVNFSSTLNLPQSTTSATVFARISTGAPVGAVSGTITNVSGAQSVNIGVSGTVNNPAGTITRISAIQGSGNTFALGGNQTIEGIVVRAFPGSAGQSGFYVQEEVADQDADAATSEGIFVFDPTGLFAGAVGDRVRVSGTVAEFTSAAGGVNSSATQLATLTNVTNLGAGTLPPATTLTLPVPAPVGGVSFLERFEGMLVQVSAASGNLTVTEHFSLRQFGQVTLAATDATNQAGTDPRIDQYTQFNAPSVSGFAAYNANSALREIILDDASSVSNPATIIHARGGNPLTASNTLRAGDDVASITAVLDERFDGYRLQTSTGVNFNAANPRPATIPTVGGTLKVGAANVLNYFNGPTFPTSRGADNAAEFTRQRDKVIANLIGTGSDVIALSEIQNNGYASGSAIQDLINGLNATAGPGTYTFVTPNATTGTDEIMSAIIYKPASVSVVGPAVPIPAAFGQGSFGVVGRSAIAQTFQQRTGGGIVTIVANHWKSKGSSSGGTGDADALDGQGFSNGTRTRQAQDLLQWLATNPTGTADPDYLITGDLNAYAQENPLTTLTNGGYVAKLPNTSYSFGFRGEWGSLDHAFVSSSLNSQVTGATKWYINADEPNALDYNTENKSVAQQSSLFAPNQYRSADHDPLVVGLNLAAPLPVRLISFNASVVGDLVVLGWKTSLEKGADRFVVERSQDARSFEAVGQVKARGDVQTLSVYSFTDNTPLSGTSYYRLRMVDQDGTTDFSRIVAVTLDEVTPTMALLGNPVASTTIRLAVRNMAGATFGLRAITGQAIHLQVTGQTDRTVNLTIPASLATGVYLLEGMKNNTRQTVRVLIN